MRRLLAGLLALALVGCDVESLIVKDEVGEAIDDGEVIAEMRGQVISATLDAERDGSGLLEFRFVYLIGIIDPEGIDAVDWRYRLYHPDRTELGSKSGQMRDAQPERTAVLVHSDFEGKRRTIELSPGSLEAGQRYVLWITAVYQGAILNETLVPIDEGVPYLDPVDPAELPELLNSF